MLVHSAEWFDFPIPAVLACNAATAEAVVSLAFAGMIHQEKIVALKLRASCNEIIIRKSQVLHVLSSLRCTNGARNSPVL